MKSSKKKVLHYFLYLFFFWIYILTEISPDQLQMIDNLPPDQRAGIMEKMETASALQDEIEEAFEESSSLVKKTRT